jgi:O-antigen/teichoic acid export membrane protein
LVFHERWLPAAGVVQGLSFGLMTQAISILAMSLLLARGEYGRLCQITGISALLTILATVVGAMLGEQKAVAYAVGIAGLISNLIAGRFALNSLSCAWRKLAGVIAIPVGMAIPILALGGYLNRLLAPVGVLPRTAIVGFCSLLLYAVAAYLLVPDIRDLVKPKWAG